MELGLEGRVALVTGGSQGIGRATALALARHGAHVAICARGREQLDAAATEADALGAGDVLAVTADMSAPEDIERFVAEAAARFGRIDVLVNNAVSFPIGRFTEIPDEAWQHHVNVKLLGYVRCFRAALAAPRAWRLGARDQHRRGGGAAVRRERDDGRGGERGDRELHEGGLGLRGRRGHHRELHPPGLHAHATPRAG